MNEIMISVDVAAAQLAELVEAIHARGHTVVLTKNGRPLARLVPLPELHSGADLANFVRSSGSEPPLPQIAEPPLPDEFAAPPLPENGAPRRSEPYLSKPPLPEIHARPPLPHKKDTRPLHEAPAVKKRTDPVYFILPVVMAGLAGVMLILLITLVVRFALLAPAPIPIKEKRPAGRDTSHTAPHDSHGHSAARFYVWLRSDRH